MIRCAAVICFTENGSKEAEKVRKCLGAHNVAVKLAKKYRGAADSISEPLEEWTGREFKAQDALIYIGAAGIAVRAAAPFIRSKSEDPAVLVMDEQGRYCIPILSGHMGGANELAELIGAELGAVPVITTATDLNGKWAVDVFAKKNGLRIWDMKKAKEVSARLLSGEVIHVCIEESCASVQGRIPEGVRLLTGTAGDGKQKLNLCTDTYPGEICREAEEVKEPDVVIGIHENPSWSEALYLVPEAVVLGLGCRKGTPAERLEERVFKILEEWGIFPESICRAASADLKKKEEGLLKLCEKYGWEFATFPAEELKRAEGEFACSAFVEEITGVDNICERSAVCASKGGSIIIPKQAGDGVTAAAAVQRWGVRFE